MSVNNRFVVDTPHGRFSTNARDGHYALIFKNRNTAAKADAVWLKTEALADYQKARLRRLGFDILGIHKATERVESYLSRPKKAAVDA